MNFNYIEELVLKYKNQDMLSKEKLAKEFKSLILNISRKTFIYGYKIHDIHNECYKLLFKYVSLYNLEKHRFVAYKHIKIPRIVYISSKYKLLELQLYRVFYRYNIFLGVLSNFLFRG